MLLIGGSSQLSPPKMNAGDMLYVPPTTYDHSTVVTLSKPINIVSEGFSGQVVQNIPVITLTADIPFVETDPEVGVNIKGFTIEVGNNVTHTNDAIISHLASYIENIRVSDVGGSAVHMPQSAAGDNTNISYVWNISRCCCGASVVQLTNTSGTARDNNAHRFFVNYSKDNAGYGIDIRDGLYGSQCYINAISRSAHTGIARLSSMWSNLDVNYIEPNSVGPIELVGNYNTILVYQPNRIAVTDLFTFTDPDNLARIPTDPRLPQWISKHSAHRIQSGLMLEDSGTNFSAAPAGTARGTLNGWVLHRKTSLV